MKKYNWPVDPSPLIWLAGAMFIALLCVLTYAAVWIIRQKTPMKKRIDEEEDMHDRRWWEKQVKQITHSN